MKPALSKTRADTRQITNATLDLSSLLGAWKNTKPGTDYIERLIVSEREGAVRVRAFGAFSPEPIDWGETVATPFVAGGTLEAAGFHAHFDFGEIETFLAANQKLGILVIQSYTSFKDGSGRANHFAREFFHQ
jgi:hypothetical protein